MFEFGKDFVCLLFNVFPWGLDSIMAQNRLLMDKTLHWFGWDWTLIYYIRVSAGAEFVHQKWNPDEEEESFHSDSDTLELPGDRPIEEQLRKKRNYSDHESSDSKADPSDSDDEVWAIICEF